MAFLARIALATDCDTGSALIGYQEPLALKNPGAYIQTPRNHHDYSPSFDPGRFVGSKVLDVGAGQALWVHYLLGKKIDAVALDIKKPRILSNLVENHFVVADMQRTPFPNETFDYVTSAYSVFSQESTNTPLMISILKEFHRILKPGGVVIIEGTSRENVKKAMDSDEFEIILWRPRTSTLELRKKS